MSAIEIFIGLALIFAAYFLGHRIGYAKGKAEQEPKP